jgi:hypothetical protein
MLIIPCKTVLADAMSLSRGVKLAACDEYFCGPAHKWARIFQDIDVKQLGNGSSIKILSLVRGRILNLKV